MKHTIFSLFGICVLIGTQAACATGVEVRPVGTHTQALGSGDAVALGQRWCADNGWRCEVHDVDLVDRRSVWRVEFDGVRPGSGKAQPPGHAMARGKGHHKGKGRGHFKHAGHSADERARLTLAFDAFSGELLDVDRG